MIVPLQRLIDLCSVSDSTPILPAGSSIAAPGGAARASVFGLRHDGGMNSIPTVRVDGLPDPLPDDLTVLDVREDDEWAAGHLHGATHIPLRQLPGRVEEVPADDQVLVYCKSGGRSAQATAFLQNAGVDAVNLDGGVIAWERAGRSLT